jgi:hypothetical protein
VLEQLEEEVEKEHGECLESGDTGRAAGKTVGEKHVPRTVESRAAEGHMCETQLYTNLFPKGMGCLDVMFTHKLTMRHSDSNAASTEHSDHGDNLLL